MTRVHVDRGKSIKSAVVESKIKIQEIFMELRSQKIRSLAPENDPLKIGMGWKI